MKILMLTWEYPPRIVGGIARVVHDLSKRLIKDGHEVTVVTYKEGNVEDFEDDNGVKEFKRLCKIDTNVLREMVITL